MHIQWKDQSKMPLSNVDSAERLSSSLYSTNTEADDYYKIYFYFKKLY